MGTFTYRCFYFCTCNKHYWQFLVFPSIVTYIYKDLFITKRFSLVNLSLITEIFSLSSVIFLLFTNKLRQTLGVEINSTYLNRGSKTYMLKGLEQLEIYTDWGYLLNDWFFVPCICFWVKLHTEENCIGLMTYELKVESVLVVCFSDHSSLEHNIQHT